MEDDLDIPESVKPAVEEVFDPGKIDISQELASPLPLKEILARIPHHFYHHSDFRYHQVSKDTFQLRVRSRKHPFFGSFTGKVHVYEKIGSQKQSYHDYAIEGLLEYRISFLWFIAVISFFFLLAYITHPGLWWFVGITVVGSGVTIVGTHHIGRDERDEVEERVESSFLLLRSTLQNLR